MDSLSTKAARAVAKQIERLSNDESMTSEGVFAEAIAPLIATEYEPVMEVLRSIAAKSDPMIADTDGDTGPDECFFCGIDREATKFSHDPSCAWLQAKKIVGEA